LIQIHNFCAGIDVDVTQVAIKTIANKLVNASFFVTEHKKQILWYSTLRG